MKKQILSAFVAGLFVAAPLSAQAADYIIDTKGGHASINVKIKHLGYSWLTGRFDTFSGKFSYDEKAPEKSKISVNIDTKSFNSNHAERDKHIRGDDFLDVSKYPKASFVSTAYQAKDENSGVITGDLTLHGVKKSISFDVEKIGQGNDPWGGYRVGFVGNTHIKLADYGMTYNLGPASADAYLELNIEGIRQ